MAKKQVKKVKEEAKKKLGGIEKEPMNAPAQEGIYELINGFASVINGQYKEYIGTKNMAFNIAVNEYRTAKSL